MDFVSWDDDYSQYDGKNNPHVANHQSVMVGFDHICWFTGGYIPKNGTNMKKWISLYKITTAKEENGQFETSKLWVQKKNLYHPGNAFLYFGGVTKLLCLHIASPLVPHKLAPLDHTWCPRWCEICVSVWTATIPGIYQGYNGTYPLVIIQKAIENDHL